jgi:hypothetical protein
MKNNTQRYSNWALTAVGVLSVFLSLVFKWSDHSATLNFMGGDAADYYSSLVSIFIRHDFTAQTSNEWYLLHTSAGNITVHPIGIAVLQLPFFLVALLYTKLIGIDSDGFSAPFQMSIAFAGLTYALLGLFFLRKLFQVRGITDGITATIILLIYFGTNLMHYTLSEPGMSHVYSFFLLTAFLFFSARLVRFQVDKDIWKCAALLGLILLARPNNVFIVASIFFWMSSVQQTKTFFSWLFKRKSFYGGLLLAASILFLQSLVWYQQTGSFLHNTYKRDGFYWMHPHFMEMLFGFDGGFFIYTPLCLLFLSGLLVAFKSNRFQTISTSVVLIVLFYFFSAYWAYTYFDGFGIRVLVDYYGVFGLLGAQLFSALSFKSLLGGSIAVLAGLLLLLNLVYTYQANRGILLRAGMNYKMWSYVFLRTSPQYQNCLGGIHELLPYSKEDAPLLFEKNLELKTPFNFSAQAFGPALSFDSIGVRSRRLHVRLDCARREVVKNASENAQLVIAVQNEKTGEKKSYVQFKLNETPARTCCESREYHYTANVVGEFEANDKLSIYVWNVDSKPFYLEKLQAKIYNYNYQLN